MGMNFGVWPELIRPEYGPLLSEVASCDEPQSVNNIQNLRKRWPKNLVQAAVSLVVARRKSTWKMSDLDLLYDGPGLEQASGSEVAEHKAERFRDAGVDHVIDLCCGIGGDAMALSQNTDVTIIDCHPQRLWMARWNVSRVSGRQPGAAVADVGDLKLRGTFTHLDPARRTKTGKRLFSYADSQPSPVVIDRIVNDTVGGAVKLGPGVEYGLLPPGDVEIINDHGTLVQAVLWTGQLSRGPSVRTATRIPDGISIAGPPDLPVPLAEPRDFLLAVDPAVERAGLLGHFCESLSLPAVHPRLGILTAPRPVVSPWLDIYDLIETLPWREKKVKAWLKSNDAGEIIVKTRDKTVDPDTVSKRLSGDGGQTYTVFIYRMDKKVIAWITRRQPT